MQFGARAYSTGDALYLAQAGLDFAEVDWREPQAARAQLQELALIRNEYGIAYLAHGPNEGDPFNVDQIAQEMGPAVCQLLDLAPRLGIALYTQHLWLDPRFLSADTIAHKIDILVTWVEHAANVGVTLCLENVSEHADHLAPAFEQLPDLCLTLDLGHGEILSCPNAAFELIARFQARVGHVHLHDNYGGSAARDHLHLPIGQGRVDFRGILGALVAAGYDRGLSLEVRREHVLPGLEAIQAILGQIKGEGCPSA
jgi:sugar phosphate isomerase/epimerase